MKIKKILALVLSVAWLVTAMSVSASAIEADYEIECGEKITVSVPAQGCAYISFVPEKSGAYRLKSDSEECDPVCELYDSTLKEKLAKNDDDNIYVDFLVKYEFVAGETYYFVVYDYSGIAAEFDVELSCVHSFDENTCEVCGFVCEHELEDESYPACPCGASFSGAEIKDGEEFVISVPCFDAGVKWLRFVPEISGAYSLKSYSSSSDPVVTLYAADMEELSYSDDADDFNFDFVYNYEAGKTYYFAVYDYYDASFWGISLKRVYHLTDAGEKHYVEYVGEVYSTCISVGYTEGLYCEECDEIISGCEETEISEFHTDEDWDDVCDLCGEEIIYYVCTHICHSENFFLRAIWSIIRFFSMLFRINPICECGMWHY